MFRKFTGIFLGAVLFFVLVLELIDVFTNLWRYMSENVPFSQILSVMLLYIPKAISFSVPLAILFAVSFVISDMYAKNELTSIFASGVSLFQFVWPLLMLAFMLSLGMFFFENFVVVPTLKFKVEKQNTLLKQETSYSNDRVIVLTDGGRTVYKADFYDDFNRRLYNLYVIFRNEDNTLHSILRTSSAVWEEDSWALSSPYYYSYANGQMHLDSVPLTLKLEEPPSTFRNIVISVDEVNIADAKNYIDYRRRAGLPYTDALAEYYRKFSFPFVLFIVVFLSIGLSGKTRKNILLVSLLLSVGAAVLYYVTQMVTMLLARFGYISPLAGAWFPVILFTALSVILLRFAKT